MGERLARLLRFCATVRVQWDACVGGELPGVCKRLHRPPADAGFYQGFGLARSLLLREQRGAFLAAQDQGIVMHAYAAFGWALTGALLLAGCGAQTNVESGLANPASVYCEDSGYTLEIRRTDAGEIGICHFPDGEECEEWAFFNGECGAAYHH